MNKDLKSLATLADLEREVVAEYRELGRQRLEPRLQTLADQTGEVSPLRQHRRRSLTLRTELGLVKLTVDDGQEPAPPQWDCPQQRAWGLAPHQKITPGLAEKLCFTAVATTSYEPAAAVAGCWGVPVEATLIHQPVRRAGAAGGSASPGVRHRPCPPSDRADRRAGDHDGWLDAASSRRGLGFETRPSGRRARGLAGM